MALGAAKDVVKFGVGYAGGVAGGSAASGLGTLASMKLMPSSGGGGVEAVALASVVELTGGLLLLNYVGDRMTGANQLAFSVGILTQMKNTASIGELVYGWVASKV